MENLNSGNKIEGIEKIKVKGVIAGFPGIGKSEFVKDFPDLDVLDLDSAIFSKDKNNWPDNYIEKIIESTDQQDAILISSYPEVINALLERGVPVTVVYPSTEQKQEYQTRYLERAKNKDAAQGLVNGFDQNLEGLKSITGCKHVVLNEGQYLSDVLDM